MNRETMTQTEKELLAREKLQKKEDNSNYNAVYDNKGYSYKFN